MGRNEKKIAPKKLSANTIFIILHFTNPDKIRTEWDRAKKKGLRFLPKSLSF